MKPLCETQRHSALSNSVKCPCVQANEDYVYFSVSELVQIQSPSTDVDRILPFFEQLIVGVSSNYMIIENKSL